MLGMSEPRPDVDRPSGISLSGRRRRRDSFLDHPLYVAGAVLFGIVLGVGVMWGTSVARRTTKAVQTPVGIDIVVDGNEPAAIEPGATPPSN